MTPNVPGIFSFALTEADAENAKAAAKHTEDILAQLAQLAVERAGALDSRIIRLAIDRITTRQFGYSEEVIRVAEPSWLASAGSDKPSFEEAHLRVHELRITMSSALTSYTPLHHYLPVVISGDVHRGRCIYGQRELHGAGLRDRLPMTILMNAEEFHQVLRCRLQHRIPKGAPFTLRGIPIKPSASVPLGYVLEVYGPVEAWAAAIQGPSGGPSEALQYPAQPAHLHLASVSVDPETLALFRGNNQ